MTARIPRSARTIAIALLLVLVGASQPPQAVPPSAAHPLVGFSFSPNLAAAGGREPRLALAQLLRRLHPDLVRIPVYWDVVAPTSESLDFGEIDGLLDTVTTDNLHRRLGRTQVILVVGARNLAWPEVHLPSWIAGEPPLDLQRLTGSIDYAVYLAGSFRHFAGSPLLYAWQVENEPLDNTNRALGEVALSDQTVADEISLLKSIDPIHRAVVTTFDSASVSLDIQATSRFSWLFSSLPGPKPAGHPLPALDLGDVLGLDVYVATPSTPLEQASVSQRIVWKAAALTYWAARADASGKQAWVTEMQGGPWNDRPGFSQQDLLDSATRYSRTGVGVVLLWGVEDWLAAPSWMTAGRAAFRTLRR